MSNAHDVAHAPKHPYHLVDPSPWPIVGTIAAGATMVGAVMFMHGGWPWLLPIGFALILLTMFFWFRDVVREATFQHLHTPIVQLGLRYGMALFIASEVMFFSAFFWARSRFAASRTLASTHSGRPSAPSEFGLRNRCKNAPSILCWRIHWKCKRAVSGELEENK